MAGFGVVTGTSAYIFVPIYITILTVQQKIRSLLKKLWTGVDEISG